jgi:hypothetical protein
MKTLIAVVLTVASFYSVLAQQGPLTQAEYVKMLYAAQRDPSEKASLIDALRKRGIDFVVTDGVRGLTRSKSRNDEELKSALDEADRRRRDPDAARLPNSKEAADVLEKTRVNTLASLEVMPDFVVKQIITRSAAYAGTGNWKPLDTVIIAVSYSTEKGEQYKVLAVDGAPVELAKGGNYSNLPGSTTGGEFVDALQKLFKPESKTKFDLLTTDTIRGRSCLVFDYEILVENARDGVGFKTENGSKDFSFTTVPAGEKGRIWIDRNDGRILRIAYNATDIPKDFQVRAFESSIDYDWVTIADEKFLLPVMSDAKFTSAEGGKLFQSRNLIRFKNYQRYGTEVKILDDDIKVEVEPEPKTP